MRERIKALRAAIRDCLEENSEGYFYCDECDALIVRPEGEYGACATTDGPLELMKHALDCRFTSERVILGLEDPLLRAVEDVKRSIGEVEEEIERAINSNAEDEKWLMVLRERLHRLEAHAALDEDEVEPEPPDDG